MKHVKKSLFISTVLMVALMVVALSTATFAWYTAQSSTTVTETELFSATSSTAAIAISGDNISSASFNNTSVEIELQNAPIAPMIPKSVFTTDTSFTTASGLFQTFEITYDDKLQTAAKSATPATIKGVTNLSGTATEYENATGIYVANQGSQSISALKIDIDITGSASDFIYHSVATTAGTTIVDGYYTYDSTNSQYVAVTGTNVKAVEGTEYFQRFSTNDFLRVAVFAGTVGGDITYKGTFSGTNTTIYAHDYSSAVAGDAVVKTPTTTITPVSEATLTIAENVPAVTSTGNVIFVQLICWFEGGELVNSNAGSGATFNVTFSA